jgi:hypothetical protein
MFFLCKYVYNKYMWYAYKVVALWHGATCATSVCLAMPASRYAGVAQREREKRAQIPRPARRKISAAYEANKENMLHGAEQLYENLNKEITSLAGETGYARSSVARVAFGGKMEVRPRGPNYHNAWVTCRMKEINSSEF